jgi:hypothetical protein
MNTNINVNQLMDHNYSRSFYDILRVIPYKKCKYLCELNLNCFVIYKWIDEKDLNNEQKNLLSNPTNFEIKINLFRSAFRSELIKTLNKAKTNNIVLKVSINEEVFRKLFRVQLLISSDEYLGFIEISKNSFIEIFGFDLENIKLSDEINKCIFSTYPVLLKKPKFIVRKKFWHKNYNLGLKRNKIDQLLVLYEMIF